MVAKDNRSIVRHYFEALDTGNTGMINALFSDDCRIYRPELSEPLVGVEAARLGVLNVHQMYSDLKTTIHEMIQEGERIAVRLTHNAVYRSTWATRIGTFDVTGKSTQWDAMVVFVVQDNKIIEEYVMRDELNMLLNVGALVRAI